MPVLLLRPKRPVSPPSLPPELWIYIFTIATWAPRDGGTYNSYKFAVTGFWWGRQHPDLRQALITRRYIVRVCRQWRTWATPLLYEHIVIRKHSALSSIRGTLTASKHQAELTEGYIPLGWWTKRLDIAIKPTHARDKILDLAPLADLIRCLPNLRVLVFSISPAFKGTRALPKYVLDAISHTCGSTLQEIYWTTSPARPSLDEWRPFLSGVPGLCKLGCPWTTGPYGLYTVDTEIALPFLTGLTIAESSVEIRGIQNEFNPYPSLQELVLHRMFDYEARWGENMWRFYGHNLTRVVLSVNFTDTSLQHDLEMLARYAPKLIHLDIALRNWNQFRFLPERDFPSISILGLQCCRLRASAAEYERLFVRLGAITSSTLKAVRFLDHRAVNLFRTDHPLVYKICIDSMAALGRCVEDHAGVRMV